MQKYYTNGYLLENQALRKGFGKMIRAINQTNPKYSFGKEKRFFSVFKNDNLPYEHRSLEDEKYGNINIGYHNKIANKNRANTHFTGTLIISTVIVILIKIKIQILFLQQIMLPIIIIFPHLPIIINITSPQNGVLVN